MAGLTARYLDSLKGQAGRRQEVADDLVRGLSLRVTEAGAKTWALRYRNEAGQQRRLTLGGYPALSLEKARKEAIKALGEVAVERDPAQEKQVNRRKARLNRAEKPQTVAELWTLYEREKLPGKRDSTADYQRWLWDSHLRRRLGANELATLDRGTVRAALKDIGEKAPTTANRALALLRHALNYAVAEEYLVASPLSQMGSLFDEKSRERVLNDPELKAFWKVLEAAPASEEIEVGERLTAGLKLVLLTLARPGDVSGLDAAEIDRAARSWTIPSARTKSGRPHVVPLSPEAWRLLAVVFGSKDPNKWTGPAFPHRRNKVTSIDRRSLTRAMARIIAVTRLEGQKKSIPRATPHDLRRTGATYLASERIGVAPHIVSAVLGHASEGPAVTGVYNRHRYDTEKRAALEAWAILVTEIVGNNKRATNVAQFRRKRTTA
jgi:integrase